MPDDLDTEWSTERRQRIGGQFSFLGRIGLYIQLVLLVVPTLFAVCVIFLRRADQLDAGLLWVKILRRNALPG